MNRIFGSIAKMYALVVMLCIVVVRMGGQQVVSASLIISSNNYSFNDPFTGFLGNSDPTNWVTSNAAPGIATWNGTNTGSSTGLGKYSYGNSGSGATFDGSLGFLPGGTDGTALAIYADIEFTNMTGSDIFSFTVGYTAEHWRSTLNGRNNGWTVSYSIDGGTETSIDGLAYVASNTNSTGTNPLGGLWQSLVLSQTISNLSIADGSTIRIRFFGDNGTGANNRQGVAIDDFTFSALAVPEPTAMLLVGSVLGLIGLRRRRWH